MDRPSLEPLRESVLRFDLAVQKSRLLAYVAALITALVGRSLHVFDIGLREVFVMWAASSALIVVFYFLLRGGARRELLNPMWSAATSSSSASASG